MAQVWKVRLPDGRTLIPGDWTSAEPLYSTVEVAVGAFPVLQAFSYGRGGDVPGSLGPRDGTLADTNLEGEGGRLPENEELVIYNMCIEVFKIGAASDEAHPFADSVPPTDAPDVPLTDMLRLQRDLLVILKIASVKEYTRSPMSYWGASTGVTMYNSGARSLIGAAADIGDFGYMAGNNGMPEVGSTRTLASPLYCAGGESLGVDIKPGPGQVIGLDLGVATANNRMRLRVFLDGYRRRPVA